MARPDQAPPLAPLLDTNVVIRHLTGDPPAEAARATAALRRARSLLLTHLVVAECVYVLESVYRRSPAEAAALLRAALTLPAILVTDQALVLRALEVHESERLHFAEAYLVAVAEATGAAEIVSFDREIDRVGSVTRREP